jgi:hypothetical protein
MRLEQVIRRILLACTMLLLLVLAWGALAGGLRQLPGSHTVGQRIETVVQLVCGILTLLVVLTCFGWRKWDRLVRIVWAVSLAMAAGLSSLVWGPPMPFIALLFAVGALLVAWAITWALRVARPA